MSDYNVVSKWIETFPNGNEIELEIYFGYSPAERMTRHYPGCDADVEICEVKVAETGAEIRLLPDFEEEVRVELLEQAIENEKARLDYLKYGDY